MPRTVGLALLVLVSACGSLQKDLDVGDGKPLPEHLPDPAYDELFDRYVELCALSQFRKLDGQVGGSPGHAVMFLGGVCRDPDVPYPALRLCDGHGGDRLCGVGVSVNRWTKNVNWLAIPGRELFFHGGLPHDAPVTQDALNEAAKAAIAAGVYEGVELHPIPHESGSLEEFVYHDSLGTDFGILLARSVLGVRVPVTEPMLREIIAFLNDLNREYATGTAEYHWSVYDDNCVHALHNSLAAANVWAPKTVEHIKSDIAVPSNTFLRLAQLTTEFPIEDLDAIWDDRIRHDGLLEFDWLPAHHGGLIILRDVHEDNEVYDPTFRLFVLERPATKVKHEEKLLAESRCYDLQENLRWFLGRYQSILAARDEKEDLEGDPKRALRRRYYSYVETKAQECARMLDVLDARGEP